MYTVLIVDDERLQCELLQATVPVLDDRFRVAGIAHDGAEALALMEETAFDLLITDIRMPVMNGLELSSHVYDLHASTKIAILSGHEEFQFVKEALKFKAVEYLLKPLNREELAGALDRTAKALSRERAERDAMRTMVSLSEEARTQVSRRFLQALINESSAEIKLLHPLTHRLKLELFEGEGLILYLSIDDYDLFKKAIPAEDIPVFHYILNQIASETAQSFDQAWTLFDAAGRTAILLSGTEPDAVRQRAVQLFAQIRDALLQTTGLGLYGGEGVLVDDMLHIRYSYETSHAASYQRFLASESGLLYASGSLDDAAPGRPVFRCLEAAADALDDPERAVSEWKRLHRALRDSSVLPRRGAYLLGSSIVQLWSDRRMPGTEPERVLVRQRLCEWSEGLADLVSFQAIAGFFGELAELLQKSAAGMPAGDPDDKREQHLMEQIKRFVEDHYAEPISLAMLADKFGVSQSYISASFHHYTGISYIKHLTAVRMKRSAELLTASPAIRIYEIAERVGYTSVKHFTYIFKKHFGITPGEYQSLHRQSTLSGKE